MKFYLAGPMRGIPQFNYPAFDEAAIVLRSRGWEIVSPSELDDPKDREMAMQNLSGDMSTSMETWGTYLSRDVKIVIDDVDGIIFLPQWQRSKGARLEAFTALAAGKRLFFTYENNMLSSWSYKDLQKALQENMP